jgi:CubicO group peptidase (beta-lactamase class C family)
MRDALRLLRHRALPLASVQMTTEGNVARAMLLTIALLLALPLAAETGAAQQGALSPPFSRARARIQRALVEEGVPSITVAVAKGGKIVWEEGFGYANREAGTPATAHTMYSLASISKPITATGLMVLIQRGSVELDRPLNAYLGKAKVDGRAFDANAATVRRVANHTAGLPLHFQFFYADEPYRRPAMDETIRRYANLVTPPGERWYYSNLGYGLLDYLIERVSGQSYADYMRETVFQPLGLTRTAVHIPPGQEGYTAVRYAPDGTPLPFYDFDHPGGSAVFASAHDLVRFGMFHLKDHLSDQRPVLSDASIDEMARGTAETTRNGTYGMGWQRTTSPRGGETVSHGGGMDGVSTRLVLVPAGDAAVVVLSNGANGAVGDVQAEVLAELFPQWFDAPAPPPPPAAAPARSAGSPAFTPMPQVAGEWTGTIDTHQGVRMLRLSVRPDGAVYARVDTQPWALVNDARVEDGFLRGTVAASVGTSDAGRMPYDLQLDLKVRGEGKNAMLNGGVVARSRVTRQRIGHALTHWAQLTRSAAK